jgi:hypothetical protein
MDLREKASLVQRVAEYTIRFRLLEILIAILFCVIALANIDGVLVAILPLAEQTRDVLSVFADGDFRLITENYEIVFAALALFAFRWIFFGFKCGSLWFFFLFFNSLLLLAFEECKDIMQILIACIFIIALTTFFFIRSFLTKSILPLILLAYSFSAWLLLLNVSNLAWFGLISVFCADTIHLIFVISYQICKDNDRKRTLTGAIVYGVGKTIHVSLLTIILLMVLDLAFYFTGRQMFASEHILFSMLIYICYAIWMPFFTAALLSFCPLENTCEKMLKKKSK